jgi:hypothetical protein
MSFVTVTPGEAQKFIEILKYTEKEAPYKDQKRLSRHLRNRLEEVRTDVDYSLTGGYQLSLTTTEAELLDELRSL